MAQSQMTRVELLARQTVQIVTAIRQELSDVYDSLASRQDAILIKLDQIEQELNAPSPDDVAVRAYIVVPQTFTLDTEEEVKMAQNVTNAMKTVFHVEFDNLAGTLVPPPAAGQVTVSLVDSTGAPSTLGTAVVGSPDGTGMDGSKVTVIPNSPAGSSLGDATISYDDMITGGTPDDISFKFAFTFTADENAASAHIDTTAVETFPL